MTFRSLSSNKPNTAILETPDNGSRGNILHAALICLLLVACTNQSNETKLMKPTTEADRSAARLKLERMKLEKAQREQAAAEQQRADEEKVAQQEAAAQKAAEEAAKPHYDPVRLGMAGKWRQWADITIPDFNIHAWLKTNWADGNMHLRLALLGEKDALRIFTGQWPYLRLLFADQGGTNLHQCALATSDLKWDQSGLRNSGTPTMEFESDSECSLEVYESIVQWNLKWETSID